MYGVEFGIVARAILAPPGRASPQVDLMKCKSGACAQARHAALQQAIGGSVRRSKQCRHILSDLASVICVKSGNRGEAKKLGK